MSLSSFIMSAPLRLRGGRIFKSKRGVLSAPAIVLGGCLVLTPSGPGSADECGAYTTPNETITCTTGNYTPPDPISYGNVDGLTLVLDDPALNIASTGSPVSVTAGAASINDVIINADSFGVISSTGNNAYAIVARHAGSEGNATITLGSGEIRTNDFQGHGAHAWISNSGSSGDTSVTMNGGSIVATGERGRGLYSRNQGFGDAIAIMNDGSIETNDVQGHGLLSNVDNATSFGLSRVVMNDGRLLIRGATNRGLYALNRGLGDAEVVFNDGDIDVRDGGRYGLNSAVTRSDSEANASIIMNGGRLFTEGDGLFGLFSSNSGQGVSSILIDDGIIEANGSQSAGAVALGATSGIEMRGGSLETDGVGLWSVALGGESSVFVSGGYVESGSGPSAGIWTVSPVFSTIEIGSDALIDGRLSSVSIRDGDLDQDGLDEWASDSITTTSGTVFGDAVLGLGNDVLNLTGGHFEGDIYGDDALASGLEFSDFVTLYDGIFSEEQLRGVDPVDGVGQDDTFNWTGGTFGSSFFGGNGSDVANITTSTYDGTYHVLDGGDDYETADGWIDVLTLSGDVSGDINGANVLNWERVNLDAVQVSIADGALQVGADPSSGLFLSNGTILDQSGVGLTLTGNMSNAATLSLQNGSVGDVITVDGDYAGSMGAFQLDIDTSSDTADTFIVTGSSSGATGILVNNVSPNTATGNDITLARVEGTSSDGDFVLANGPVIGGAFQYDLEYRTGDFVLASMLSPTGAVFEAAPYVLLDGMTRMPTLEQRVGQRRWNSAAGTLEPTSGGWIRIHGDWSEAGLDTGTSYDVDTWGLQAGFDIPVEPGEYGQWVLGLTAQTGNISADIATMAGTGSINSESIGFGATATWYGYNDLYVDLQGQVNWAGVDYRSSLHGLLVEDKITRSYAASIEIGRRFSLDENRALIPQAQLTWAGVDGGRFTDITGNAIDLGTNERITGRLGLAYDYEWRDEDRGSMQNFYGIVNILHDFSSDASVDVASASLASTRDATWGEIGLGGSVTWDDNKTLYAEASYRESFGSGKGSGFAATAGFRIQW